jgi:hypothetical protein
VLLQEGCHRGKVSSIIIVACIGIIGGALSPVAQNKLNSLAMLLDSDDAFEIAFADKHAEAKEADKPMKYNKGNHD